MKTIDLKMFDLAAPQLDDGTIRLEQRDYCGEPSIIDLHPFQLRHLAEQVGAASPSLPDPPTNQNDIGADAMHHLEVERDDDGTVNIFQTQLRGMGGSDEHLILHPIQAAWLGARLLALGRLAGPVSKPVEAPCAPSDDVHACPMLPNRIARLLSLNCSNRLRPGI